MSRVDHPDLSHILSHQSEAAFETLVSLTAQITQAPIAFLSFVNPTHQWLKFQVGFQVQARHYLDFCNSLLNLPLEGVQQDVDQVIDPENLSVTSHPILISDTQLDRQVICHFLVSREPAIRFYAGIPVVTPQGQRLGLLSVMDYEPRTLSRESLSVLQGLANQIGNHIELCRQLFNARDKLIKLERVVDERKQVWEVVRQERDFVCSVLDTLSALVVVLDAQGRIVRFNRTCEQLTGYSLEQVEGKLLQGLGLPIFDLPWEVLAFSGSSLEGSSLEDGNLEDGNLEDGRLEDSHSAHGSGSPMLTLQAAWFPQEAETEWISSAGTCHLIAWSNTALLNPEGALKYVIAAGLDITERKRSEEALQESEERYRLIADNSTDLIAQYTCKGVYGYVSPASSELLGYSPDKLVGQSIYQMVHPEDVEPLEQFHQALIEVGESNAIFYRYRHHQGHYLWFETTVHPVYDPVTGEIQELVAISRDITERKKTEASLIERSQLSLLEAEVGKALGLGRTLPTILKQCVSVIDTYLDVVSVTISTLNSQTNRLEPQATCGETIEDSEVQTQAGILLKSEFPLIAGEHLVGMMILYRPYPLSKQARQGLQSISGAIAAGIDRVRTREDLYHRREGLLFRLANQIRESLDIDTILTTAVNEIQSVLQVDQCHFLWCVQTPDHQSLFMITHEARSLKLSQFLQDYPPDQVGAFATQIQSQEPLQIDNVSTQGDFEESTRALLQQQGICATLLLPLRTRSKQQGAIICHRYSETCQPWSTSEVELLRGVVDQVAIAIDQAELYAQTRAAALAAQTQAAQLSQTIQELKQKETQLIQSEKMSSLGQMVAGVAHEINNPVNFIYGNLKPVREYTQGLLDLLKLYQERYSDSGAAIAEKIEEIDLEFVVNDLPRVLSSMEVGTNRIRQIVISLRNFSRLDEAEMKPVDIHEGLDSTLLILQNRLKPKRGEDSGIEIVKHYGQLPQVECYPGQLNQVFMNILNNAMDALDEQDRPGIVTITTEITETKSSTLSDFTPHVLVRIQDNGPGMTAEVRNKLFDPFFTTKPVGKGTGLGLSISYKIIVEKHGGQLICCSEPGKGAEFQVQIPIHHHHEIED